MDIDREAVHQVFLAEAEEQLAGIEQGLVELEARPGDPERLHALFRLAHTFKGNAFCVGLQDVTSFAHAVEEALECVMERKLTLGHELATLLLDAVDALRRMIPRALDPAAEPGEPQPAQQALLAYLSASGVLAPAETPAPPAAVEAPPEAPQASPAPQSLRVTVDKLDRMLDLAGELAVARGRLSNQLEKHAQWGGEWAAARDTNRDVERLFLDLQDLVMRARLVAIGPTFRQHVRGVRDLALALGKQVRVVMTGQDVEVDTAVVQGIRDPLTHLVRNAVSHGIERPEARVAAGKDPVGTVWLRARHEAGRVVVEVGDDGAGMDRAAIARRARETGLCLEPERLADDALLRLVLEPGFSTAAQVTEISGRGIGMDVVRRNVESLRGVLTLRSEPGKGSEVRMALPLTLAIIEGFSVGVGPDTYVIPLESVVECVELPRSATAGAHDRGVLDLRGQPLPFLRLREFFGLPAGVHDGRSSMVVIRYQGGLAGLAVDALHGEGQTVIKPLGRLFRHVPGVSGSALLGTGRVALILDVPTLFEVALAGAETVRASPSPEANDPRGLEPQAPPAT